MSPPMRTMTPPAAPREAELRTISGPALKLGTIAAVCLLALCRPSLGLVPASGGGNQTTNRSGEQSLLSACLEQQLSPGPPSCRAPAVWLAQNDSHLAAPTGGQFGRRINWNLDYVDEQTSAFEVKIHDTSIDQRLANVVRTTNLVRLFYYFMHKFDSPVASIDTKQLEQLAAGPRASDDALCGQHLGQMLDQMHEMRALVELQRQQRSANSNGSTGGHLQERHLRLAKVLDSFGRYEAGALTGRTYFLGSYAQCKGSRLLLGDRGESVPCRYCMASLDASRHMDADLSLAKERLSKLETAEDVLAVGICLPDSCHTKSFARNRGALQALVDSQFELPAGLYQDQHLELAGLFCEIDPESPLLAVPLSGKLLLAFIALWLAAVLYSTYYNNVVLQTGQTKATQRSEQEKYLQCLDLKEAYEEFTGQNQANFEGDQHRVSLNTLNPVKVIGCALVVYGHAFMVHQGFAANTLRAINEMQDDPKVFFALGSTVIVDSFYVITGIIITFVAMKKLTLQATAAPASATSEEQKSQDTPKTGDLSASSAGLLHFLKQSLGFVLTRYLRLIPLYFLVFWFKKSLMTTLSSGPLWDHGYNRETEAGACREESWLTPFTFQAAYLPLSRQCMPQAWSVAGDLFFSFILGPILVLLVSRPQLAALLSVAISLASNASLLLAMSEIPADVMEDLMNLKLAAFSRSFRVSSFLYTAPHHRVFSVLVGGLAGYALYHYGRASGGDKSHPLREWPAWFRGPATKLALWYIFSSVAMMPTVPLLREHLLNNPSLKDNLLVHLASTNRLLWALACAIVFLRMVTDWKDNFWMRNGAGKFWSAMAKLNFGLLLIHIDLLKLDHYKQFNTITYSGFSESRSFAWTYLFGNLLAVLLYLLFEKPMDSLIKYATRRTKNNDDRISSSQNS